jgi:hypothetical protein
MNYTIRLHKESGQVIPLMMVVQGIAKGFATRWGEQSFHRGTFEEVERRWSAKIVEAAKRGELRVCDSDGFAIQAITDGMTHSEVISEDDMKAMRKTHPECQIAPGIWNFTGVDFGNRRKIEVAPVGLFITLRHLNEWAASRGDSYTIEEMPVDVKDIKEMRCVISGDGVTPKVGATGTAAIEEPETKNWILLIQAEAARRWKQLRKAGANPTKNNIKDDLANWCRESNVVTDGDINPNAAYIARHVLQKWKPPKG